MADIQDAPPASEPSMEEILASIRRIISDEKDPNAAAETDDKAGDVLELTQMVQDDGSVVNLSDEAPVEPAPEPPPAPMPEPEPEPLPPPELPPVMATPVETPPPETPPMDSIDTLISEKAATAATSALAALANTVQIERIAASHGTPVGNGARTLEDMVVALMKPMLKEWLDQNLAQTVDRLVQKEIERIASRAKD